MERVEMCHGKAGQAADTALLASHIHYLIRCSRTCLLNEFTGPRMLCDTTAPDSRARIGHLHLTLVVHIVQFCPSCFLLISMIINRYHPYHVVIRWA